MNIQKIALHYAVMAAVFALTIKQLQQPPVMME